MQAARPHRGWMRGSRRERATGEGETLGLTAGRAAEGYRSKRRGTEKPGTF
jgi:hypothetical protein